MKRITYRITIILTCLYANNIYCQLGILDKGIGIIEGYQGFSNSLIELENMAEEYTKIFTSVEINQIRERRNEILQREKELESELRELQSIYLNKNYGHPNIDKYIKSKLRYHYIHILSEFSRQQLLRIKVEQVRAEKIRLILRHMKYEKLATQFAKDAAKKWDNVVSKGSDFLGSIGDLPGELNKTKKKLVSKTKDAGKVAADFFTGNITEAGKGFMNLIGITEDEKKKQSEVLEKILETNKKLKEQIKKQESFKAANSLKGSAIKNLESLQGIYNLYIDVEKQYLNLLYTQYEAKKRIILDSYKEVNNTIQFLTVESKYLLFL